MIFGIGTDIVEVERFQKRMDNETFLHLVYTSNEIAYCNEGANRVERFAARFAAKEAFFKALGTGFSGDIEFTQAEVVHNSDGRPSLIISGAASKKIKDFGIKNIHLSLSHEKKYATAFVILES